MLNSGLNLIAAVQGKILASLGVILFLWLVQRLLLRVAFQRIEDSQELPGQPQQSKDV